MEFTILHTNDIHSNFENFSKIVSKIRELKNESTLLLDAGDFADFKRTELQGTDGIAAVDLLYEAGYDAIAIGNNETFNGIEVLETMAGDSRVPFLSCHISKVNGEEIKGVKRSILVEKSGVKVLLIGASPSIGEFDELMGLKVSDYLSNIKREVDENQGLYDLCIVISHLGMDKDRIIAREIPQVDVIIGGHFHILHEEPEHVNSCLIHSSGQYGEHLGVLKISLTDEGIKLKAHENIKTTKGAMDEGILRVLKENREKAVDKLSEPLYKINRDLWHDVLFENPITNLLADSLKDYLKADIGLINSGVLSAGIRKGDVNKLNLLLIAPSPLNPTTFIIEGREIFKALEMALDGELKLSDGRGPGYRGKYAGILQVSSNVKIYHDNKNILKVLVDGEELKLDREYLVASSDYLQRGTAYEPLKNNRDEKYDNMYIRDLLQLYLKDETLVESSYNWRWTL